MGEQISHSDVVTAIGSLRAVLAVIEAGELSCSPAYRNRLQGAVVALDSLAAGQAGAAAPPDASGDSNAL